MNSIIIAQVNSTVGRVEDNCEGVHALVRGAKPGSLLVFPAMALTGTPLGDLGEQTIMAERCQNAVTTLERVAEEYGVRLLIGGTVRGTKGLAEALFLIEKRSETRVHHVEDGAQSLDFEHDGQRVSAMLPGDFTREGVALPEADVLLLPVAQALGAPGITPEQFRSALAAAHIRHGAMVNLAGGQDSLVFPGESTVINDGFMQRLPAFRGAIQRLDDGPAINPVPKDEVARKYLACVLGLRDYLVKNGIRTVTLGVSGGIDSALVATMAADAIGGYDVFGVSLPSPHSSEGSRADARELMVRLGGDFSTVPIGPMMDTFSGLALTGVAAENLQARLRAVVLMGLSNQHGHLLLAPGTKSELAVGYSTIYGDAAGGFAPIKDVYKTEVFAMARWRNGLGLVELGNLGLAGPESPIPVESITKAPSAELSPGQVDTDSLPDYPVLDALLRDLIEGHTNEPDLLAKYPVEAPRVLRLVARAEWKRRQYPIGPKVSTRCFGVDWDMPITR